VDAASTEAASERSGHSERSKLVRRAGVIGAGTLLSRLLGLARDMALAGVFGRAETDAFFVAFTIPNALRQVLAEGAVSSALVPVLSKSLAEDGDAATARFFARARGASLVLLTLVTVAGVLAARPLTDLFAHGYASDPAEFARTARMTALVFPYIFFMGTAALGMAALNAKKKFAVAAFAPGLLNVAFLVASFAFPPLRAASIAPWRCRSAPSSAASSRSWPSGRRSGRSAI
jgi:putative peptidoglycan lipid II flippase